MKDIAVVWGVDDLGAVGERGSPEFGGRTEEVQETTGCCNRDFRCGFVAIGVFIAAGATGRVKFVCFALLELARGKTTASRSGVNL